MLYETSSSSSSSNINTSSSNNNEQNELVSLISDEVQRDSGNSSHCSSAISSCSNSSSASSCVYEKQPLNQNQNVNRHFCEDKQYNCNNNLHQNSTNQLNLPCGIKLNKAPVDFNVLNDERLIENLLYMEDFYTIQSNYFQYVQTDIKPWMRKMLANWMSDVCKSQFKEEDIFLTAMNILDRFLSVQPIGKRHLQLLGTVCMFIAAKLRSAIQFNAETLVIYTANSITIDELLNWEQFVLHKLRWDINTITPNDFVPHLINKLDLIDTNNVQQMRQNLTSFIALTATDFRFSLLPSSMIASSCIYTAFKSLNKLTRNKSETIINDLHKITGIDLECLRVAIEQIEDLIETNLKIKLEFVDSNNSNNKDYLSLNDENNKPKYDLEQLNELTQIKIKKIQIDQQQNLQNQNQPQFSTKQKLCQLS